MTTQQDHSANSGSGSGLILGILLGLGVGFIVALLTAPSSGKESQRVARRYISDLSDRLGAGMKDPDTSYHHFFNKTRVGLEGRLEKFKASKKARRLARAKRREFDDMDVSVYEV
ncbi:MAG: YtxH domain-containing protein [Cyanobacteria bacterium HKST-UBA06]|nr:YtxH domain-containing protein [Cyanobacteria bacterium HKST-UBA05]MCA9798634.1 YtxH domain-containing protein [Cyanobacteria bacterium HKST-UBA04]MCA9807305.1 YtxH domain-containing protein [Cyanobacteria bacterium HKST-UBA06]MCA9841158.1 YtxH domain-containing protein [Cyanobacteria bacterium HKST-UBA03]